VAEYPFAEILLEQSTAAERPRYVGVVGVHAANYKRQRGQHLRQWRMFLVHPHVQLLQIAHTRPDVRHFIKRNGFTSRGPVRKHPHKDQEQNHSG
jgi:hypothetical protein